MIERERRFLVAGLPDRLPEPTRILQSYLTTEPVSVRVRHRGDRFTLTLKAGHGLVRTEIERELTAEEFEVLWQLAGELRIEKRRHVIELGDGHRAELDLYDGPLEGRRLVEVEFDSDETAARFDPPAWFGREVTEDGRYTNVSLARNGWPDEP